MKKSLFQIILKKKNNTYFFNWKSYSCRYDCFCYILTYKLIGILEKIIINNKEKLINIKDFSFNLRKLNNNIFKKGFFEYYKNLKEDCLNIKNNLDKLKVFDNITDAFKVLEEYNDLKISYFLTEKCLKCNPFGKTTVKYNNLIYVLMKMIL